LDNYENKLNYLLRHQRNICPICWSYLRLSDVQLHHKMSKVKWAVKKFPLFIHSLLNLVAVHPKCHMNNVGGLRTTPYNAERYENFLKRHKKLS
jgi:hypothetical protein